MNGPTTFSNRLVRGAVAFVALSVIVFLLAPIVVVLIEAFNDSEIMKFPPRSFSFRWFIAFYNDSQFMNALWVSLRIAVVAATISTVVGTMAAISLARARSVGSVLQTLLLSPLYVPRVLIGLSLLLAFAWLNITGGYWGMLVAHVLITMPYAIRTVIVGMRAVEPAVEEAARMLGATGWQTFHMVTLPIVRSAILSGFIFSLIVSFSDIYLALFISGPQTITLPLRLFTFMEWDQSPLVAAASAVQITLILTIILIAGRLFGLSGSRREH